MLARGRVELLDNPAPSGTSVITNHEKTTSAWSTCASHVAWSDPDVHHPEFRGAALEHGEHRGARIDGGQLTGLRAIAFV